MVAVSADIEQAAAMAVRTHDYADQRIREI